MGFMVGTICDKEVKSPIQSMGLGGSFVLKALVEYTSYHIQEKKRWLETDRYTQNILRAEHIIMGQCLYFCFNSKTQP